MKRIRKRFSWEVARYNGRDECFHGGMNDFVLSLSVQSGSVSLTLIEEGDRKGGGWVRAVWSNLERDFAKQFAKAVALAAKKAKP